MKKRISLMLGILMMAVMSVAMVSCGSNTPTAENVAKKLDSKETLTQNDYAVMLDYCGDYAKKAQKYFDIINPQPNDSTAEYQRAADDLAKLSEKYPYLDMFRGVVYNVPLTDFDEANQKKVEEYSKYQAFPLPDGAGVNMTNPTIVGDIEDMPFSNGTDTTVIATGDGVAVDTNVAR